MTIPENIKDLTLEELVELAYNIRLEIEDLQAARTTIDEEVMARMPDTAAVVGDYQVTKRSRQTISDVSEKTAKELGAMREVIDKPKILKLYKAGAKIDVEVKTSTYLQIKPVSDD